MYESHFHFNDRPFSSATNPEHYFPASSVEQAREAIARNVERASSVTLLVGPVGSGKSLICQLISNQYASEFPVCLIQGERLSAPDIFLQSVLHKLGLPFRLQEVGELRLTLAEYLTSGGCVNGILLVIDDADQMSGDVLHEVRSLTNLTKDGQSCARVLLAGSSRLEENIGAPEQESLNQRVAGRLYLGSFSEQETADYVRARVAAVGGDATGVFTEESLQRVYQATLGVPRLVNQICDHALILASINGHDQLTGHLVEEAWADMQQLPVPPKESNAEAFGIDEDSVVEFGGLEDEVEDPTETAELGAIKEALGELGVTAVKATRPIIVGGEVEFEGEDLEAYAESVLPIRSPLFDDEVDCVDFHEPHDQPLSVLERVESEAADDVAEGHFEFECEGLGAGEADEPAAEEQKLVTQGHADAEELMDSVQMELERELFEFDVEPAAEQAELTFESAEAEGNDEPSQQSVFVFDSVEQEDVEQHAFFFGGDVTAPELPSDDSDGSTSEVESEAQPETELASDPGLESEFEFASDDEGAGVEEASESGWEAEQPIGFRESAEAIEVEEDEFDAAVEVGAVAGQIVPEVEDEAIAAEQLDESTGEEQSNSDLTLEHAVNPFSEEFEDEEIVVQKFVSPSIFARGEYDPVTAATSRQLASQLSGAGPLLRMHSASIECEELSADDEFEPLSKFIEQDTSPVGDAVSAADDIPEAEQGAEAVDSAAEFDASSDPVMPEGSFADANELAADGLVASDGEVAEPEASELIEENESEFDDECHLVESHEACEAAGVDEGISDEGISDEGISDEVGPETHEALSEEALDAETDEEPYQETDVVEAGESCGEPYEEECEQSCGEAVVATIGIQESTEAATKKPRRKRLFRTLFSNLRAS